MSAAPIHADNAAQAEYWNFQSPDSDGPTIRNIRIRFCARFPTGSSP